jgi:hypothetical protein
MTSTSSLDGVIAWSGLIQQRYGTLKEDAEAQVTAFERRLADMHNPVNS